MLKKKNIVYIYGGKYIISILSSDVCPVYVLENFGLFIYLFFFLADKLNVSHNFGQKNFKCVKENAHLFSPNFSYYLLISSVSMLYLL